MNCEQATKWGLGLLVGTASFVASAVVIGAVRSDDGPAATPADAVVGAYEVEALNPAQSLDTLSGAVAGPVSTPLQIPLAHANGAPDPAATEADFSLPAPLAVNVPIVDSDRTLTGSAVGDQSLFQEMLGPDATPEEVLDYLDSVDAVAETKPDPDPSEVDAEAFEQSVAEAVGTWFSPGETSPSLPAPAVDADALSVFVDPCSVEACEGDGFPAWVVSEPPAGFGGGDDAPAEPVFVVPADPEPEAPAWESLPLHMRSSLPAHPQLPCARRLAAEGRRAIEVVVNRPDAVVSGGLGSHTVTVETISENHWYNAGLTAWMSVPDDSLYDEVGGTADPDTNDQQWPLPVAEVDRVDREVWEANGGPLGVCVEIPASLLGYDGTFINTDQANRPLRDPWWHLRSSVLLRSGGWSSVQSRGHALGDVMPINASTYLETAVNAITLTGERTLVSAGVYADGGIRWYAGGEDCSTVAREDRWMWELDPQQVRLATGVPLSDPTTARRIIATPAGTPVNVCIEWTQADGSARRAAGFVVTHPPLPRYSVYVQGARLPFQPALDSEAADWQMVGRCAGAIPDADLLTVGGGDLVAGSAGAVQHFADGLGTKVCTTSAGTQDQTGLPDRELRLRFRPDAGADYYVDALPPEPGRATMLTVGLYRGQIPFAVGELDLVIVDADAPFTTDTAKLAGMPRLAPASSGGSPGMSVLTDGEPDLLLEPVRLPRLVVEESEVRAHPERLDALEVSYSFRDATAARIFVEHRNAECGPGPVEVFVTEPVGTVTLEGLCPGTYHEVAVELINGPQVPGVPVLYTASPHTYLDRPQVSLWPRERAGARTAVPVVTLRWTLENVHVQGAGADPVAETFQYRASMGFSDMPLPFERVDGIFTHPKNAETVCIPEGGVITQNVSQRTTIIGELILRAAVRTRGANGTDFHPASIDEETGAAIPAHCGSTFQQHTILDVETSKPININELLEVGSVSHEFGARMVGVSLSYTHRITVEVIEQHPAIRG